jgi:hypothetical protein
MRTSPLFAALAATALVLAGAGCSSSDHAFRRPSAASQSTDGTYQGAVTALTRKALDTDMAPDAFLSELTRLASEHHVEKLTDNDTYYAIGWGLRDGGVPESKILKPPFLRYVLEARSGGANWMYRAYRD